MATRRAASRLATRIRAVRDVPAPPSARYLDVFDRVGVCETRAQDDDRRASARGAGPLPRGFAASCASRSPSFSETPSRSTRAWTVPPPPGAARARASSSSTARAKSAPSATEEATTNDVRRGSRPDERRTTAKEASGFFSGPGLETGDVTSPTAREGGKLDGVGDDGASSVSTNARGDGRFFFNQLPEGTAAICVTSGVLMAGHACVAPVLPAFATEFGASAAQVGACLSAFALARLLLNVPSGALADVAGRRPLLVAGPLVTALGMFGCAAAGSLPELLLHRFVAGAGSAVYASGASATLADLSTSVNRGRVLGANQAAALAGAAAGPAVGGAIVAASAPFFGEVATRAPFLAVGVGCLYAAAHAFRGAPETLRRSEKTEKTAEEEDASVCFDEAREKNAPGASSSVEKEDAEKAEKAERVRLARRDFFAASGVNAALFFSGSGGRATLVPLLAASTHGFDVAEIGALFSAMALTSLLGAAPAAALADAVPRRRVVFGAMALSSVAVAATAAAPTKELFAGAAVAWAAAHALMGPAPAAYAADVAGPRARRGAALATYRTCGDVGMLVGPVALGAAADAFGAHGALGANGAVLGASALGFRAAASDRDHRRSAPRKE